MMILFTAIGGLVPLFMMELGEVVIGGVGAGLYGMLVFVVLAGSMVKKKISPPSAGTFPVSGTLFTILLLGTVVLVGALNFLPALALCPVVEHFLMLKGNLF